MKGIINVGSNIATTVLTWIITNVVGTCVFGMQIYYSNPQTNNYIKPILSFGLVCSIPGMIVYHITWYILFKLNLETGGIKIILSFLAILIVAATIVLFLYSMNPDNLNHQSSILLLVMAYSVPFIICIFLFKQNT